MTWAEGQCQHCGKHLPRKKSEAEFCSPLCAREYTQKISDERHGLTDSTALIPAPTRAITKTSPAAQRIRHRIDSHPAVPPSELTKHSKPGAATARKLKALPEAVAVVVQPLPQEQAPDLKDPEISLILQRLSPPSPTSGHPQVAWTVRVIPDRRPRAHRSGRIAGTRTRPAPA